MRWIIRFDDNGEGLTMAQILGLRQSLTDWGVGEVTIESDPTWVRGE